MSFIPPTPPHLLFFSATLELPAPGEQSSWAALSSLLTIKLRLELPRYPGGGGGGGGESGSGGGETAQAARTKTRDLETERAESSANSPNRALS